MPSLRELEERRAYECRLSPDRALASLEEAEEFLRDRGLLTRTPDSSLPSLFTAMHEEPYAAGSRGFGNWPRTKYRWSFELLHRRGVYAPKIHRGKTLYLSEQTVRLVDPICRTEIARLEQSNESWALLLRHLADAGPSLAEDLKTELGLSSRELRSLRAPLERCGAIVSRDVIIETDDGGHRHTAELARWDDAFPEPSGEPPDLGALVVAGVRAAVLVPEHEPKRWFSWAWRWEDDLIERLAAADRLTRPLPGWLAI